MGPRSAVVAVEMVVIWSVWESVVEVAPMGLAHELDVDFAENRRISNDCKVSSLSNCDAINCKGEAWL